MLHMTNHSSRHANERGIISGMMIAVIGLSVLVLGLGSFGIWAFVAYNEAQSDLDGKIAVKVAEAREKKGEEDDKKFQEQEKQPNITYKAPDNYCGLRFQYPKTWSVYESEQITNGGDFKAYFNPKVVPPVSNDQQYALRVLIEQRDYDRVISDYQNLVQKGMKQSTGSSNGLSYTRLTGDFSKNIRGDAVIYDCRDKTITVRTDADTFKTDFEAIIRTIDYNK